jgi:hypothetical protein
MVTAAGSGYSRWNNLAVTRWREDATCDDWGSYIYLRDRSETGAVWSAGYQPSGNEPDAYEVAFSEDRADIVRRDGTLTTTLEILVSPEDDAEVRRVTLVNGGTETREIEFTSYAEIVLAPPAADAAHPAFSKIFVQTEFVAAASALLATRRPRSPSEAPVWAAHFAVVEGATIGEVEIETDRARFIGRNRSLRNPLAVLGVAPLSGTTGTVLDPVFALRHRVSLAPGATARVAFWTVVATSRAAARRSSTSMQTPPPSSARRRSRGRRRRCSCVTSASAGGGEPLPASRGPRALRRSLAAPPGHPGRGGGRPTLWAQGSRATCRSWSCAHRRASRRSRSSASSCARTSTGA